MTANIVYSPDYDFRVGPLAVLHPFDAARYSRTFAELRSALAAEDGRSLAYRLLAPDAPVSDDQLRAVHTEQHITRMRNARNVLDALGLGSLAPLFFLPFAAEWLQSSVVGPMRLACAGTHLAAEMSVDTSGLVVHLGGGYHHAAPDRAEGFCLYSDIGLAIRRLYSTGRLSPDSVINIVDVDAHQGNGLQRVFRDDQRIKFLDVFNRDIYPADLAAMDRIDLPVPVHSGTNGRMYLRLLEDALSRIPASSLAFAVLGNDVLDSDQLGQLALTDRDVHRRDAMVVERLRESSLAVVTTMAGGYSVESAAVAGRSLASVLLASDAGLS